MSDGISILAASLVMDGSRVVGGGVRAGSAGVVCQRQ